MSIKRRGLWAILTGAPLGALGVALAPAKAESVAVEVVVKINDDLRDLIRVTARAEVERHIIPTRPFDSGDWRTIGENGPEVIVPLARNGKGIIVGRRS